MKTSSETCSLLTCLVQQDLAAAVDYSEFGFSRLNKRVVPCYPILCHSCACDADLLWLPGTATGTLPLFEVSNRLTHPALSTMWTKVEAYRRSVNAKDEVHRMGPSSKHFQEHMTPLATKPFEVFCGGAAEIRVMCTR